MDVITDFSHLAVKFWIDTKENKRKSAEAGRPIHDEIEMVEIRIAGDPKMVNNFPVHSRSPYRDPTTGRNLTYAEVHHAPYQAWKEKREYRGSGTPLTEMTSLTAAKVADLNRLNIFTVEALAGLDGANLSRIGMGARDLKVAAQTYLDKAAGTADLTKYAQENAALKEQQAALEKRLADMERMLSSTRVDTPPPARSEPRGDDNPFESWDDDTLRVYLEENGGGSPPMNTKHETLVAKAKKLNDELIQRSKAA